MDNEEKQSTATVAAAETPKSGTDQVFADFRETLKLTDMPDADSRITTTLADYRGRRLSRWKKKCMLERQSGAHMVYQSLNETIGVFAQKDAVEIRKKIDSNIEANKKNVGVKLAEATKAIKEARTKLELLKKKGEELNTAASSHAMSADLAAIIKLVPGDKNTVPEKTSKDVALETFDKLKALSAEAFEKADDAAEVAIRTAGLHASANMDSLKPLGVDIEKAATDLQADLAKNIKETAAVLTTTREEYQKIMQQLAESKYAWFGARLNLFGLTDSDQNAENPECTNGEDIAKKLNKLQEDLKHNFKSASSTVTPTTVS